MSASSQMQRLGTDPQNRTWYFADNSFLRPGVYYWDGRDNVHAGDKINQLETDLANARSELEREKKSLEPLMRAIEEITEIANIIRIERDRLNALVMKSKEP